MPNPRKIEPQFNPKLRHESTPLKSGSAAVRVILVVTGTTLNVVNRGGGGGASGFQTLTLSLTRSLTLSLHLSLCRGTAVVGRCPTCRSSAVVVAVTGQPPSNLSSLSCCVLWWFAWGWVENPPLLLRVFFAEKEKGLGPLIFPFLFFFFFLGLKAQSTKIVSPISNLLF